MVVTALEQIERLEYGDRLRQDRMEKINKYSIACNRKSYRVMDME